VLGIGSELRGDDAAGILVARDIEARRPRSRRLAVFEGHTAPESLTGPIVRFLRQGAEGRRHLVLVDAADLMKRPGTIVPLRRKQLAGTAFSTHQLPLGVLVDYIATCVPAAVTIFAIQPASAHFGAPVSPAVRRACRQLAKAIHRAVAARRGHPQIPPVSAD
jgi:hydrogenase 3 maturation protease